MMKSLASWAVAHPEAALVYVTAIVTGITSLYAAVKIAFQRVTGRAAKGGVWSVLDVAVELLPNVPGAVNRLLRSTGAASIFAPPASRAAQAAPPPSDPQRGTVRVGVLVSLSGAVLVACLVGAALTGCPRLPPVTGCTPMAYRCTADGRPEVCSSTQRWEPVGDESCAAAGAVCVVERTAHCAPMQIVGDAGVSHD